MRKLLISLSVAFIAVLGLNHIAAANNKVKLKEQELHQKTQQIKKLDNKFNSLEKKLKALDKNNKKRVKQLTETKKKLENEREYLKQQLISKRHREATLASKVLNVVTGTQTAYAAPATIVPGCGDNEHAQFIYQHESGCNLSAVNPSGCRGIGQACPGDKLPCGADYACQNAFFTQYATERYGGWAQARSAWEAQGWW